MTITSFKKVSLFSVHGVKADVLAKLQALGCMHIICRQQKPQDLSNEEITLLDKFKRALHYINESPHNGQQKLTSHDFQPEKIVDAVLANQKNLREAIDQHDILQEKKKNLVEWGYFMFPLKNDIADFQFWFYKIRIKDLPLVSKDIIVQEIYRNSAFAFLIVIAKDEPHPLSLPAERMHTGAQPLAMLEEELEKTIDKIEDLKEERRRFARYKTLLKREIAYFLDRTTLEKAGKETLDEENFFLIQGWVPETNISDITHFSEVNNLTMMIETPTADELPPTLMETYPWAKSGAELVNFYQTPGYHSPDPSLLVFFSFSLFFAMILADASYGVIIAFITLLFWRKLSKSPNGVWLKPLLITISLFSIIYGVLVGSYFGVSPAPDSFLGKLKILDMHHFKPMMIVVLVVGCLHIIAANVLSAWSATSLAHRAEPIGFINVIIGIMLLSFGVANDNGLLFYLGILFNVIGASLILIFAGTMPVTNFKSFTKRTLQGLTALTHLTSLFGDLLSYLRLFALGLAGASLAITFNKMASHIADSGGYGAMILAFLVLLLGQTLNFILCIMSGVIHGLRLNFIEFFKWSIKEDGYVYSPLKKTEVRHE